MSDVPASDVHSVLVSSWEKKAASHLSSVQHVQLLEKGIKAVEQRACQTLSRVTLLVILDRVFQKTKVRFPILLNVKLEESSLNFNINSLFRNKESAQLILALRFFLIELLSVLGRITADILTIPLHEKLLKVTWNGPEKK